MTQSKIKKDKHFPLFAHDNFFRRLFGNPQKYCAYAGQDKTVADLGCGPGFYALPLAESVGPRGRVYAVDSDARAIQAVEIKAAKGGYKNIEARVSSAADLGFIKNNTVDFVLADGLLCSMAPQDHASTISEIKRILKPGGKAFLTAAKGSMSYAGKAKWEAMLEEFDVEQRDEGSFMNDRWAIVSKKQ